jgi:hypothetical protein
VRSGLDNGFLLDRQWHWLRREMAHTKRPALLALCRVLGEAHVPYAIIGGVALQIHQQEPRTTLDIDVAVAGRALHVRRRGSRTCPRRLWGARPALS